MWMSDSDDRCSLVNVDVSHSDDLVNVDVRCSDDVEVNVDVRRSDDVEVNVSDVVKCGCQT